MVELLKLKLIRTMLSTTLKTFYNSGFYTVCATKFSRSLVFLVQWYTIYDTTKKKFKIYKKISEKVITEP